MVDAGRFLEGARAAVTTSTLTSIACAAGIISVAGLDQAAADDDVLAMSGRGPRPWSGAYSAAETHPAPLLAAPAGGLFGARSKTTGYMRGSGTSGAAAIVSGACALAMQAAEISGQRLEARDLTNVLLGRPDTLPADAGWRADVGLGALRFDASAILAEWTDAQLHPRPVKEKPRDERTLSSPN